MLLSQHAIVGSVVAVATGNPVLGFCAALASHHLLDMVPHFDGAVEKKENGRHCEKKDEDWPRSTYILAYVDVLVTILIIGYLALRSDSMILVISGAIGGSLLDILDNVPWWKDRFRTTVIGRVWHTWHERLHYHWHNAHIYQIILAGLLQISITLGGILWVLSRG